jgi:hypothetical protein
MAVLEGVQGLSPAMQAFVQTVRLYTRDFAQLNRLIAGEESNDRIIAWAVMDAMADFNGTPPWIGNWDISTFLGKSQQALLLRMTVITLLESVGLLQTRNHINYSNGGINVGVNDKTPLIMNWLQYFKSSTDQMKQKVKVAANIEGILGPGNVGVHSELFAVNASYLSY